MRLELLPRRVQLLAIGLPLLSLNLTGPAHLSLFHYEKGSEFPLSRLVLVLEIPTFTLKYALT